VKFHQNAKNQNKLGLQPLQRLLGTFLKNKKYKVFGLGSPDLEHLLLEHLTKQQQDYNFLLLLSCMSCLTCPVPNLAISSVLWMVAIKVKQKTSKCEEENLYVKSMNDVNFFHILV
jgi:hypothetical protein